jgi:hypothetical protein
MLASLFQAATDRALSGPATTIVQLSPATAALADGNDVRAHFLASKPDR